MSHALYSPGKRAGHLSNSMLTLMMFRAEKMMVRPPGDISPAARILGKIMYAKNSHHLVTS